MLMNGLLNMSKCGMCTRAFRTFLTPQVKSYLELVDLHKLLSNEKKASYTILISRTEQREKNATHYITTTWIPCKIKTFGKLKISPFNLAIRRLCVNNIIICHC